MQDPLYNQPEHGSQIGPQKDLRPRNWVLGEGAGVARNGQRMDRGPLRLDSRAGTGRRKGRRGGSAAPGGSGCREPCSGDVCVGEYGLRKRSFTAGLDRQFRTIGTKGLQYLSDDLTGTLTLLGVRECHFAGANLPAVGSALRGIGAEGADRSGTPLVEKALVLNGNGSYGRPRTSPMAATVLWVAPAPKVRHVWWIRPCQRSIATRGRVERVKGIV
jgi:hypothetical protein